MSLFRGNCNGVQRTVQVNKVSTVMSPHFRSGSKSVLPLQLKLKSGGTAAAELCISSFAAHIRTFFA
jgi:hypothetical protein